MKAGRSPRALGLFVGIVLAVLVADLVSKPLAFRYVADVPIEVQSDGSTVPPLQESLQPAAGRTVVPYVLGLKLTMNHGAVFGLGQGQRGFLMLVSLVAVVVIVRLFWVSRLTERWLHLGLAMVLAGALGNLYDRIQFGAVRDLLFLFPGVHLPFGWHWPGFLGGSPLVYPWIFNIADVALVGGVAILLIVSWRLDKASRPTGGS